MKKVNFYLLYGDDKSILNNELDKIKKFLGISDDTIYYDIENISDIVMEASTIGMFSLNKFIVVDSTSYLSLKKNIDVSLLEDYFNNYNKNSYLVFVCNSSSVDTKKKMFKLISDNGVVKKIDITNNYLNDFVSNYLNDFGYTMDNITIRYFTSRCGNNIDNIKNELDKLMLYRLDNKNITKDDVALLVDEDIDDSVFDLVSSILKNNNEKSMKIYYNFINNGMDINQIVAIIASQIRLLFQVKRLYNKGKSNEEIAKILDFKSVYRVKYLLSDAYLYSESDLIKYLSKLADIDAAIKSGSADGKILLELFIAKKDM